MSYLNESYNNVLSEQEYLSEIYYNTKHNQHNGDQSRKSAILRFSDGRPEMQICDFKTRYV
jgi:hypothetical protein